MKNLIDPIEQQATIEFDQLVISQQKTSLQLTFPNPYNYICIRKMFGEEENKDVLIGFINDVLSRKELKKVVQVEFLDLGFREDASGDAHFKIHPIDAMCTAENGEQFIVEIGSFQRMIPLRSIFEKYASNYAQKVYYPGMCVGGKYEKVQCIHFIAILAERITDQTGDSIFNSDIVHGPFKVESEKDFFITYFEPRNEKYSENNLDQWGSFFSYISRNKHIVFDPLVKRDAILKKAFKTLDIKNWTLKQLRSYLKIEAHGRSDRDHDFRMLNMGYQQGIYQGRLRVKEKMAQKLFEQGLSSDTIARATELSPERLRTLQAELSTKKSA